MICARLSNAGIQALQRRNIGGPQWGGSGARSIYVEEQDAEGATELLRVPEFTDEELAELSERAYEGSRLNAPMQPPILINVWTVDPSQQAKLAQAISDGVRNVIVGRPGFVSAQVYESPNGDAIMVVVRMRTIKERQELTDSPEAHSLLRELRAIARSHVQLFRLVESFGESEELGQAKP